MSDRQAAPPTGPRPASIAASILLFVIGVILLLPGLCALFFMGSGGGGTEPIILLLWLICFAITAGGIALIVHAVRRQRRR